MYKTKTVFSARDKHVLSFSHWVHQFLTIFSKVHEFSGRHQRVLSFWHWAHHVFAIFSKVHQCLQHSFLIQRSAFLLCVISTFQRSCKAHIYAEDNQQIGDYVDLIRNPLIGGIMTHFQQSPRVCTKQRFQLEISTFCHFCTGYHFLAFSAKCTGLCKTAFPVRDRHVLSFSHCAHHFLTVFSKMHGFVQDSVFSPRSARFVIFALGAPLFSVFSKVH